LKNDLKIYLRAKIHAEWHSQNWYFLWINRWCWYGTNAGHANAWCRL